MTKLISLCKPLETLMYERVNFDGTVYQRYLTWSDTVEGVINDMMTDIIYNKSPSVSLYISDRRYTATDILLEEYQEDYPDILQKEIVG